MSNNLALLGHAIKAAAADKFAKRLGFSATQTGNWGGGGGVGRGSMGPVFWPNGLINMGATVAAVDGLDIAALRGEPLENATVAICVDRMAQALPDAPPFLEQKSGQEWKRVDDHPALDLLRQPNEYHSDAELWGMTVGQESTRGHAYWIVPGAKSGGTLAKGAEIWPVQTDRVTIKGTTSEFIAGYTVQGESGTPQEFSNEEIIHFRHALDPHNPRLGWCPLMSGGRPIAGDNATANHSLSLLVRGGVLSLLIAVKDAAAASQVTPAQMEEFLNALKRKLAGGSGAIVGLPLPLEVTKMGYSLDEMHVPELITFFKTDICALLNVSRRVADLGDDPTYENLKIALKDFWVRNLKPRRMRHARILTVQYLPLFGLDPVEWRVGFDYSSVEWLQEDQDELHERVRGDYEKQICDKKQARAALGYAQDDATEKQFEGVFFAPTKQSGAEGEEQAAGQAGQPWQNGNGSGPGNALAKALKAWDESQHPRGNAENAGEFSSNGASGGARSRPTAKPRVPEPKPSAKAARAKAAHVLVNAKIQRYAEEHNEPRFARAVGGVSFPDSEPIDVAVPGKSGRLAHGVELKTMVANSNNKITMKRDAIARKAEWERKNKAPFHTVVFDDSAVFEAHGMITDHTPGTPEYAALHDESKRRIFYRRGFGSFRVGSMHEVKDLAELQKLMNTAEDKLPPAARRIKAKEVVSV